MDYTTLKACIEEQYAAKKPFVLYALPESNNLSAYLQSDTKKHTTSTFMEKEFVFAPFDFQEEAFSIPYSSSTVFEVPYTSTPIHTEKWQPEEDEDEKERYKNLVKKTVAAITTKKTSKIVISRRVDKKLTNVNLSKIIDRLLSLYPTAFRYVWYHPETDLWCGATPEVLVKTEGPSFTTMALAGTKKYNEKHLPVWSAKEIEEQQIVTDAIATSLQKVTSVVKISKTKNHLAGSLIHLKTDITGILKRGKATLSTISAALHPTPAVCGAPKKIAKSFILDKEGYNREFYTGFLGPICENEACSKLYVNLRCMKISGTTASLYVGGGITWASDSDSEWTETQNKLQTMMQVIVPML